MHNDEIVQREGSTLTRESFNNVAPTLTIRQRIHEIENIHECHYAKHDNG